MELQVGWLHFMFGIGKDIPKASFSPCSCYCGPDYFHQNLLREPSRLQAASFPIHSSVGAGYWLEGEAGQCGYATPWINNYTGLTRASRRSYLPVSPRKFSSTQIWMNIYLQKRNLHWVCLTVSPTWLAKTSSFCYQVCCEENRPIRQLRRGSLVWLLSWSCLVVLSIDLWLVGLLPRVGCTMAGACGQG